MLTFVGAGLLIGGVLGSRLTVLALIPVLAFVLSVAALAWMGAGDWNWAHLIALVVFLQIGYVCGAALRLFVAPAGLAREGKGVPEPL